METNSSKTPTMQEDIEKLKAIDPVFLQSMEEEMKKAIPFFDKANDAIKMLNLKDMVELKCFAKPPEAVVGVLCALQYPLAGNVPDSYVKTDEKKNPVDLTWTGCKKLLADRNSFFEYTQKVGEWINDEKITYEMTVPVRGYLEKEWFSKENLKRVSIAIEGIGEFVRNMIEYFDVLREVRGKVRARAEESGRDE